MVRLIILLSLFSAAAAHAEFVFVSNTHVMAGVDDLTGRFILSTVGRKGGEKTRSVLYYKMPPTSVTAVKVDQLLTTYGSYDGYFAKRPYVLRDGVIVSEWRVRGVSIIQVVQIVEGPVTGERDTVRVSYLVFNFSGGDRRVSLQVLFDTYLGEKDNVNYLLPDGTLVQTEMEFKSGGMPAYWYALDNPRFPSIGILGTFRHPLATLPDRVLFSSWKRLYDYPLELSPDGRKLDPNAGFDSAVGISWEDRLLTNNASARFSGMFGLFETNRTVSQDLVFSLVSPARVLDPVFHVYADVTAAGNGAEDLEFRLELPAGLEIAPDSETPAESVLKELPAGGMARLDYKVRVSGETGGGIDTNIVLVCNSPGFTNPIRVVRGLSLDTRPALAENDIVAVVYQELADSGLPVSNETVLSEQVLENVIVKADVIEEKFQPTVEPVIEIPPQTNTSLPDSDQAALDDTNLSVVTNETIPDSVLTNTRPVMEQTNETVPEVVPATNQIQLAVDEPGDIFLDTEFILEFNDAGIRINTAMYQKMTNLALMFHEMPVNYRVIISGESGGNSMKNVIRAGLRAENVYSWLSGFDPVFLKYMEVRVDRGSVTDNRVIIRFQRKND